MLPSLPDIVFKNPGEKKNHRLLLVKVYIRHDAKQFPCFLLVKPHMLQGGHSYDSHLINTQAEAQRGLIIVMKSQLNPDAEPGLTHPESSRTPFLTH